MIRLVVGLVVVALAGVAAAWLADHPGLVRLDWGGWRIETSLGILILVVFLALVAALGLYRGWLALRRSPRLLGRWRSQSRQRRGERAIVRGLVAVAAGDARDARKRAREAETLLGGAPLARLLAAQAAQLAGDDAEAERHYEAMLEDDETAFLGLKGLIAQARRRGDKAAALALVERARALRPGTPWVAGEVFQLQVASRNWAEAEATLAQAVRRKLIPAEDAKRQRAVLLLARAQALHAEGLKRDALKHALEAHRTAPDLAPAGVLAARLLADDGKGRQADKVIEAAWAAAPHPELAEAHARIHEGDGPARRAERLDHLVAANPEHPESKLLVADRAVGEGRWADARAVLEPLARSHPSARVFDLLARVERGERGDERAAARWLSQIAEVPPAPQWVCARCGHVAAHWAPDCPACHAFDTLAWRLPGAIPEFLPPMAAAAPAEPTDPAGFADVRRATGG
jgi:HemY protein